MSPALRITFDEWRQWQRSGLGRYLVGLMLLLTVIAVIVTGLRMDAETQSRLALQSDAEQTFLEQPDRHPHRMVHYGHYVFHTPPPLAVIDPGVLPVTGQSLFLEGHRQNAPMFSDQAASASLGRLSFFTPAFIYQLILPLILILVGHGVMAREREAGTLMPMLAQGVAPSELMAGKALALTGLCVAAAVPLLVFGMAAVMRDESGASVFGFSLAYFLYLLIWSVGIVLVSALLRTRGAALAVLTAVWLMVTLILPVMASNVSARAVASMGKIEADFALLEEMRTLGDGHNAADPAFDRLTQNLLIQYGVASVEDLPVNIRGVIAGESEAELTEVLNRHARNRMATELRQDNLISAFGWLSPTLALRQSSMQLADTGLAAHHRFLEEAEAVRFEFVQGLNRIHAEKLTYADDSSRRTDPEAERRTRVSAENWAVLERFNFVPAAPDVRLALAASGLWQLALWFAALTGLCGLAARRLAR